MSWWPWQYKQAGTTTSDVSVYHRDPHVIHQGEYAYCDVCDHFFDVRDKRATITTGGLCCPACAITSRRRVMTPEQIRAARALIGWTQAELAERAKTSQQTVDRIERGEVKFSRAMTSIQQVLSEACSAPHMR